MISGSYIENFVKLLSVQPEPPPPDLVLQVEVVPEESRLPETKVIIEKSRGEGSPMEQDTIENVS